jgi:hypothetical protein
MNRRDSDRVPLQMVVKEFAAEGERQSMTLNVSSEGLYVNRLSSDADTPAEDLALEIQLPGTSDTIWATAAVCHNRQLEHFQGTGMRFLSMADKHRRLLKRYLRDYEEKLNN